MNVTVVTNEFPGLSSTFVTDQVTGLAARGLEVRVLAARPPAHSLHLGELERHGLPDRTHYWLDLPRGGRARAARLVARLPAVRAENLRFARAARRVNLCSGPLHAAAIAVAARLPAARRTDVVLAQFGPGGLTALALREAGLLDAPIVTVFRGYDLSREPRRRGPGHYRVLFDRGEAFFAVSRCLRDRAVALGCPPQRIEVHRSGVDLETFVVTDRPPRTADATCLCLGRLVEKKGFDVAVAAMAQVRAARPGLALRVAGEGPERAALEAAVDRLGLRGTVTFIGPLDRAGVRREMRAADMLLVPSRTAGDGDCEGLPVVLTEGFAAGLPTIVSDDPGIAELVEDGVSAWVVAANDASALAAKIVALADDPAARRRLAVAGRAAVVEHHDIQRLNDRLVQRLADVAAAGRRT